ncbi:MAG: hypothetical protein IT305_13165 [Chloroflexi bacterium]|nr:hypothetical protein [Chloroflexota bacterium]
MTVVRLNVADEVGAQVRERFQVAKVPTVILLDGSGAERYRSEGKLPRRARIRTIAAALGH